MKETEITCLCNAIRVPDLGLDLKKGDVVYVSVKAARKSKDLKLAWRAMGLAVREVERVKEQRKPPKLRNPNPSGGSKRLPPRPNPPRPVPRPVAAALDTKALAAELRTEVSSAVRDALADLPTQPVTVVARGRGAVSGGEATAPEPTFIPSGIVKDTKADIKVEASESEASGLDAAAKALKGRKKVKVR